MSVKHFVDEIPPETGRKYNITTVGGESTIEDLTVYEQVGTKFGSADVNAACILECNHAKAGTVHALTTENTTTENLKFTAVADFVQGDTFTLNGIVMNALMPDGNALSGDFFKTGAVVFGFVSGANIYFVGGGGSNSQAIITLTATNGASMAGRTVTVYNNEDDTVIETFVYDGQAHTVLIPVATVYRVECSATDQYVTPTPSIYTAVANTPRSITMSYQYGLRYGFRREKNNSSPLARITYLYDAIGKTPGAMNFTSGAFGYGRWEGFVEQIARPVMLKNDGTVDYELDHSDQTKKIDGITASDVSNTSYAGNAMVEFNDSFKWVHRSQDANYEYVIFSNVQFDETYECYAHKNAEGIAQSAFYWGMFKGTNVGNKLRSIGTGEVMVSQTRNTEVAYATANGDGYNTIYKSGWDYICDLLTLIGKSDNTQAVYGTGRSKSNNTTAIAVGSLKAYGAFMGYTNETSDVKVLWIEGFWGNVWEGMAGLILDGANGIKTKMTPPYNFTGSGYTATGVVPGGSAGGFVNVTNTTKESGYVPVTASGSEIAYMCDGLWYSNGQVDYALVGGSWADAGRCGARCVTLNDLASYTNANIGSRLSYIPA